MKWSTWITRVCNAFYLASISCVIAVSHLILLCQAKFSQLLRTETAPCQIKQKNLLEVYEDISKNLNKFHNIWKGRKQGNSRNLSKSLGLSLECCCLHFKRLPGCVSQLSIPKRKKKLIGSFGSALKRMVPHPSPLH